jgi:hypothetical protein
MQVSNCNFRNKGKPWHLNFPKQNDRAICTRFLLNIQNVHTCRYHTASLASSCFSTTYCMDHVSYVLMGAGDTTDSSRYFEHTFHCRNMRSVYFLCNFVTFTVCCSSSHNSFNKFRQVSHLVLLKGGVLPAIPSLTGLIPLLGCNIQQSTPIRSSSCVQQWQACSFSQ